MESTLSLADAMGAIKASGRKFYVYILRRPNEEPFYVGKGTGERLLQHERHALQSKQDGFRLRIMRSIINAGGAVGYEVAGTFDGESEAFACERRLIALHGRMDQKRGPLVNHTDGGEGASNPSEATLKKRSKKLRVIMNNPERKALAVKALHSVPEKRIANHALAMARPENKAFMSAMMSAKWATASHRAKAVAGMHRAMDLVGLAKVGARNALWRADPIKEQKRKEAARRPEALAKMRATMAMPEAVANRKHKAAVKRAEQSASRARVMALADTLNAVVNWPLHTSSTATWLEIERRLMNGERSFDADPLGIVAKRLAALNTPEYKAKRSQIITAKWQNAETRAMMVQGIRIAKGLPCLR